MFLSQLDFLHSQLLISLSAIASWLSPLLIWTFVSFHFLSAVLLSAGQLTLLLSCWHKGHWHIHFLLAWCVCVCCTNTSESSHKEQQAKVIYYNFSSKRINFQWRHCTISTANTFLNVCMCVCVGHAFVVVCVCLGGWGLGAWYHVWGSSALTQQLTLGHYFHLRHVNLLPHQLLLPICEAHRSTLTHTHSPIHSHGQNAYVGWLCECVCASSLACLCNNLTDSWCCCGCQLQLSQQQQQQ